MPSFASSGYDLPKHNEVEMTREMLLDVLNYFSQLTAQQFGNKPIRFVVHGGACMLLHEGLHNLSKQQQQMSPGMPGRTKTRDVDYIHRSFVKEMQGLGVMDAEARIRECIRGTARRFGLGLDWMNSDADIALPMAHDPSGNVYDPVYAASVQDNNIHLHTIYRSPDGLLTLISVTPFWAVALKLVRYSKWDPGDICLLLRNGQVLSHTNWSPESLENWLQTSCWAMGYAHYDGVKKGQMRSRIQHAIDQLAIWNQAIGIGNPRTNGMGSREGAVFGRTPSQHDAMGGGEVVGGGG
ncbi:hypothetical protein NLJ89_g6321 [Agrocybe chaxingu]|uniref:Uncharacterized protein n=1 Tax=Agrocybe chaxingu TaxID=84603 RepID=A0A9W8JZE3_9AGAR|nr:hypothetical protein NLJ89_g6321 [Agrocybe chaxingu]